MFTETVNEHITEYADRCMFDTFIEIYRTYYVGMKDGHSKEKLVHEICKQISSITMDDGITCDGLQSC